MISLQYIRNTFIAPLQKAVDSNIPMISRNEFMDITSNLPTLVGCHVSFPLSFFSVSMCILSTNALIALFSVDFKKETFLQSLKDRVVEWEAKPYVQDLFTEKAAFLKLYGYYVANHHQSLEAIDKCIEKNTLFAVFLRELEAREKVELKVLLAGPLRRISAYYLQAQVRELLNDSNTTPTPFIIGNSAIHQNADRRVRTNVKSGCTVKRSNRKTR